MKRASRGGDPLAYLRAFGLLARNPALLVAPLLMTVIGMLVGRLLGGTDTLGGLTGGIGQFIVFLLDSFGLGVSLIIADAAWRRGTGSFEEGWSEARRKGGDILLAAIGLNFVIFIASYAGSIAGGYFAFALSAIALYFFIYAIPAAAIGGVPGGAALQISLDRVRSSYLPTLVVAVISIAAYILIGFWLTAYVVSTGVLGYGYVAELVGAVFRSIAIAYIAVILARAYNDVSYGRY